MAAHEKAAQRSLLGRMKCGALPFKGTVPTRIMRQVTPRSSDYATGVTIFVRSPNPWNDVVSSAYAYNTCWHFKHFWDVNYGQPLVDCNPGCATMGAMNDQTSSETWNYNP